MKEVTWNFIFEKISTKANNCNNLEKGNTNTSSFSKRVNFSVYIHYQYHA